MSKQKEIIFRLIHGVKPLEKYPEAFRQFCVTLHFHSPRAYEFVRQTFNKNLPHAFTIRSWYANSNLNIKPNTITTEVVNILEKKSAEKFERDGKPLVVALKFDEMHIRKHYQWSNRDRKLMGLAYVDNDNIPDENEKKDPEVANQSLVFYISAVNDSFELPFAYYFLNSMDGAQKQKLVQSVIEAITNCKIIVASVTFDGFQANKTMCRLFGAVLNVYSPIFKPNFILQKQRVNIFFDAPHMIKLIRNRLATKGMLIDGEGNAIEWKYFVELVRMKNRGFTLPHKMNLSHIAWHQKKMKVEIAVQTLSASTAASMELLMKKGLPEFVGAEANIKFIRIFDSLFDIKTH